MEIMTSYSVKIRERRVNNDRRRFNYTAYSPERRSGIDRRACKSNADTKVA